MPTTKNLTLFFRQLPTGVPVPGKDIVVEDQPIDLDADIPENSVLLEHLYASIDPYMRGRLRDARIKSYSPAFDLNQPMNGGAIARVLKSTSPEFKTGDIVSGGLTFQQYSVVPLSRETDFNSIPPIRKLHNPYNLEYLPHFLGAVGMPGLTAYSSLFEIGQPKKGETIFVSSAAGAVGQVVGQLAKHEGLTVIGSVGSDEKLEFITKELGYDHGFNYKKESPADALKRLAPNGIDIYFENVGGEHLSAALDAMNTFGRVVVCGLISQYNKSPAEQYAVKNITTVLTKRLTMRGFIVGDPNMGPKYYKQHQENVGKWLKEGTFKAKVDELGTMANVDQALVDMLQGKNFGKAFINCQK